MGSALDTAERLPGIDITTQGSRVVEIRQPYQVLTASSATSPLAADGLPAIGDEWPTDTKLIAENYETTQDPAAHGKRWEVVVVYRTAGAVQNVGETPTYRLVNRAWGPSGQQRDVTFDVITGEPVVNSAGDPFDGVPQAPVGGTEVVITRLEKSQPHTVLGDRQCTVNDAETTVAGFTFAAKTAYLEITCKETEITAWPYEYTYKVTQRVNQVKPNNGAELADFGWRFPILDQGYRRLDGGVAVAIMEEKDGDDGTESPVTRPVLLDGAGDVAAAGVFEHLVFDGIPAADWSGLNLNL